MSGDQKSGTSAKPRVSAVVVSYFTGPVLTRCLASLNNQPEIGEIILVDNGNPPTAIEIAIEEAGSGLKTKVLSGHGNIGFASACNKGVDAATNDLILLFNPDAVMPRDGLQKMLNAARDLSSPWVMGGRLVDRNGAEQQGSRRGALTPVSALLEATQLYRIVPGSAKRRFNFHETPKPASVIEIPTLSGACFFISKADYLSVGGMDERYFLHVEDVDFCRRFSAAGGRVLFHPDVAITHFKGSSRVNSARVERLKTQSMICYFRQHFANAYPAPTLRLLSALLWVFYGLRMTLFFIKNSARKFQFFLRKGFHGLKRAQGIHARRLSR